MTTSQIKALTELKKLFDANIIDQSEFDAQKKAILSEKPSVEYTTESSTRTNEGRVAVKSQKKTKTIIIVGIAVIGIVIAIIVALSGGNSSYNSYQYSEEVAAEVEEVVEADTEVAYDYDYGNY